MVTNSLLQQSEGQYFQSYKSIIAFIPFDRTQKIKLDSTYWDYSNTTRKYRNIFLSEDSKDTKRKIADGIYELVDLNTI